MGTGIRAKNPGIVRPGSIVSSSRTAAQLPPAGIQHKVIEPVAQYRDPARHAPFRHTVADGKIMPV